LKKVSLCNLFVVVSVTAGSEFEMLLQEHIHLGAKARPIHQVELSPAGKANRPVPHRRHLPIQQPQRLIHFGNDLRAKELPFLFFLRLVRLPPQHPRTSNAIRPADVLLDQFLELVVVLFLVGVDEFAPGESLVVFEGLDVLFPVVD
jgi:hypothetical protein